MINKRGTTQYSQNHASSDQNTQQWQKLRLQRQRNQHHHINVWKSASQNEAETENEKGLKELQWQLWSLWRCRVLEALI